MNRAEIRESDLEGGAAVQPCANLIQELCLLGTYQQLPYT